MWVSTESGLVNLDRYDEVHTEQIEGSDSWCVMAKKYFDNGYSTGTVLTTGSKEGVMDLIVNLRRVAGSIGVLK